MKIKFIFAWYDFWVGLFWDAQKGRLYIFLIPMFGLYMQWPRYIISESPEKPDQKPVYWRNMRGQITYERANALRFSGSQIKELHAACELVPRCAWSDHVKVETV